MELLKISKLQTQTMPRLLLTMFLLLMPLLLSANDSDKASGNFLQSIFPEEVPNSKTLWLETDIRKQAEELVQHPLPMLRVRYWQKGQFVL